jgi:hypothetical protein
MAMSARAARHCAGVTAASCWPAEFFGCSSEKFCERQLSLLLDYFGLASSISGRADFERSPRRPKFDLANAIYRVDFHPRSLQAFFEPNARLTSVREFNSSSVKHAHDSISGCYVRRDKTRRAFEALNRIDRYGCYLGQVHLLQARHCAGAAKLFSG